MATFSHKLVLPGLLAAALCGPAPAATVIGFDGIVDLGGVQGPETSVEDGVTITLSDGYDPEGEPALSSGSVHLDDVGTAYASWVELLFPRATRVLSLDINGLGIDSWSYDAFGEAVPFAYQNVLIEGGGAMGTVSTSLASGLLTGWQTVLLGSEFANLDWLRVTAVSPSPTEVAGYESWDCSVPCGHFDVDNVAISMVPLPATLPPLAAGIGLLTLTRRRRT